jgi:hypothetical protein
MIGASKLGIFRKNRQISLDVPFSNIFFVFVQKEFIFATGF